MTEQIKSVIQTLNANQAGEVEASDRMAPLDVVVRIPNNQLNSLMWIDEHSRKTPKLLIISTLYDSG
ncbi:unnamed protein product [Lactuca virosa]|uniref:Uncharacterized protein n=1 Tax=Lactuca virosa TaxID=75947 RepID=A0AAU9PWI4_9ASTR|nr:unnamed protein product [Lactuca virosa]